MDAEVAVVLRGRVSRARAGPVSVTQDRLDIRGYIDTARKHGLGAYQVIHQKRATITHRQPG